MREVAVKGRAAENWETLERELQQNDLDRRLAWHDVLTI
jgi:hypothetical protein